MVIEEVCPFLNVAKRECYALPQQPNPGPFKEKRDNYVKLTEYDLKLCQEHWQSCPNRALELQLQELEAQGFFRRTLR